MTIWTTLARAGTASGDDIILRQRGEIFEIRYNPGLFTEIGGIGCVRLKSL